MKYLLPIFLITASCGDWYFCETEWYEVAGLQVCDNGYDVWNYEIKQAVETLQEHITTYYPEVIEIEETFSKHQVDLTFTEKTMAMECKKIRTNVYACDRIHTAVNIDGLSIYALYDECLADTPLVHELLHSIEEFYLDGATLKHITPYLFPHKESTPSGSEYSVENIVNNELRMVLNRCQVR